MSKRLYPKSMPEAHAYLLPQFHQLDHQLYCNDSSPSARFMIQNPNGRVLIPTANGRYCTLESSSATIRSNNSTLSLINGSPLSQQDCSSYPLDQPRVSEKSYGSPASSSCITDDKHQLRNKLMELETVMLGPDYDVSDKYTGIFHDRSGVASPEIDSWRQMMEITSKKDLRQGLLDCALAISEDNRPKAQYLIAELEQMVSVSGEPIQRLGAYVLEGLIAKFNSAGSSIYEVLRCKEPASSDLFSYMHILYEVCPYFKFGYMSANGAIAEAMKDEDRVHIIDFQIGQGSQWLTLIRAFAARPGGPPHIRITGIDDSISAYARGGGLETVGKRLSKLAESYKVPFKFHAASRSDCESQQVNLGITPGEALAVNFAFILHHLPDESVSTHNHRDRLLRLVKGLSPKVVTLVEQESNTNTAAFFPRFLETMNYYTAMFESIDATLPRNHKDRIHVEQHCLAKDVVNIIACEGAERVKRHELLGKWKSRFAMAGFRPYPLSSLVNATIKTLLENYSDKYKLEERDGALYLGWMNRALVGSCAWT
uniref:Scarecrow-like transcription factor PAT1 n=1 Tax=Kalanchoe fedtschenkoi TaxID=63787 RepID=A0A7N0RJ84_KALFE